MKFRKKPVVVEAERWFKNGDHPLDYVKDIEGLEKGKIRTFTGQERKEKGWEGDLVRYFRHPEVSGKTKCKHCGNIMDKHGWIDTLEGGHTVCPGDWIIKGIKGEFYPCKPDTKIMDEEHKRRHQELHKCLDELSADFISHTTKLPSDTTLMELMSWSHKETLNPTKKGE